MYFPSKAVCIKIVQTKYLFLPSQGLCTYTSPVKYFREVCFASPLECQLKSRFYLSVAIVSSLLLSACGGGSSSGTSAKKVSVTGVATDQLIYRKTTNITVTGQNLDLGINIANLGCLKITEVPGSTSTQKVFSCKMIGVGSVAMNVTAADGSSLYAGTMTIPLAKQPQITMVTSLGTIVLELNPAKAPITVDNFLQYTENSFYVNKIFHRVINGFMIQGGGFTSSLQQPTTLAAIKLEVGNGLSNIRGSIAMARTNVLDSATSQFFINVANNESLDTNGGGYAVFGKVVSGLDVVDKIKVVATSVQNGLSDVPVVPVIINSVLQTQ
jgi:peptidyl-prolyl cis-trans isomerase A (cyclophilin A)